jgi:hypothetical protein
MKLAGWAYIAFVAALAFLIVVIAERQHNAAIERLSIYQISPQHRP